MTRSIKPEVFEIEDRIDLAVLLAQAAHSAKAGFAKGDAERAMLAVTRLIAASEPGSSVRNMSWRKVATLAAKGDLSISACRRPKWPNAPGVTLVL